MQAHPFSFAHDRLEARLRQIQQENTNRENLLQEEIAKWKSQTEWYHKILLAYVDEMAKQGLL